MYDVLVIGGGINGAGIARDAAGRGLKTLLCERDDLAQHTSSSSTKLIHGGLRYLEYYDFGLVRKALIEREVLLRSAPHIITPMRFVLPHQKDLRPSWMIRLGLFFYDYMGGRKALPPTKVLRRKSSDRLDALKDEFTLAFEYSDCWVDDARLVVLNAVSAKALGAEVLTQKECVSLERKSDYWVAKLRSRDGEILTVETKVVINAAGPWVDKVFDIAQPDNTVDSVRLVKGSHIITPKLFDGDYSYFFQNGDGRIIFAIPYESGQYTLIGTTDVPYNDDPSDVCITDEEICYLCDAASEYFKRPVTPCDVVSTYSGVRPLYEDHATDASAVSRDYVLSYDDHKGAPILSVYGGKITTYRELAERALELLEGALPHMTKAWTKNAHLPGGNIEGSDFEKFLTTKQRDYAWLPTGMLQRLAHAYGARIDVVLGDAETLQGLGQHFGAGLYEREARYLVQEEFACSAEDVLWRRSKLGLHMTDAERNNFETWVQTQMRETTKRIS